MASNRAARAWPALRTILIYAFTLFVIVTIVFALPRAMPGDPIQQREDPANSLYVNDPGLRHRLMAYYGLDRPIQVQYVAYLVRVSHGDFGWSIAQNRPVAGLIGARLPWTLLLMGSSIASAALLGWVAGIAAAWRRGRPADRILVAITTLLRSVPEYALAMAVLIVFAVTLRLLPLYGGETPFATYATAFDRGVDVLQHLVLPWAALTLGLLGSKFLLVRNTTVTVLGEDYMMLARAKGLPPRLLKYRHAGRNALLPFLTILGIQVGFAVGGAIFVESVFAYPGMGTLILTSVSARDYPVLEAIFLILAGLVLAANLVIELVYRRLDPRVAGG